MRMSEEIVMGVKELVVFDELDVPKIDNPVSAVLIAPLLKPPLRAGATLPAALTQVSGIAINEGLRIGPPAATFCQFSAALAVAPAPKEEGGSRGFPFRCSLPELIPSRSSNRRAR